MKPSHRIIVRGVAFAVLFAAFAYWWWGGPRQRGQVASLVPEQPELASGRLDPLAEVLRDATTRARQGDQDALVELAKLYHGNGFERRAVVLYRGLSQLEPEQPRWSFLARELIAEDIATVDTPATLTEAAAADIQAWRDGLWDFCFDAERLAAAARDAAEEGRSEVALRWVQRALTLSPENGELHFQAALLWEVERDQVKALAAYRQAVQLDPQIVPAWLRLIMLYQAIGDTGAQLEALRQGLAANPDAPGLLLERGKGRLERGRFDDALKDFSRIAELVPGEAIGYLHAARVHLAREDMEQGIEWLQRALAVEPQHPTAQVMLTLAAITRQDRALADASYIEVRASSDVAPRDRRGLEALYRQTFGEAPPSAPAGEN